MFQQLVTDSFKKAREETGFDQTTRLSNHLSERIDQLGGISVNERTLRNYYGAAIKEEKVNVKQDIADALSKYLGFDDYFDYFQSMSTPDKASKRPVRSYIIGALFLIVVAVLAIIGMEMTKEKCMTWSEKGYYERSNCDLTASPKAISFEESLFKKMKRLELDCNHEFFDSNGAPKVWYSKKNQNEIELFSHYGLHPVTNKTLKPITPYIVDKYICN